MSRTVKALLCMVMLGVGASAVRADALADQKKAQNKLLACRAARADAIRRLAERINGLHITASTTVKDFVTESDKIKTAMVSFLSGMKEVSEPKYMEDGTCEVVLEVSLEDLVVAMEQMYTAYYKGDKIKIEDIRKITVSNEVKTVRETGNGAPRPEFQPAGDAVAVPAGQTAASVEGMNAKAKAYWLAHVTGQGRLMAVRAAQVDAMRRLGERIRGVRISSKTTVQDFVTQSDEIKVDMRTFLQGAREVSVRYHEDEPIVEVQMEVLLRTVLASLEKWGETHFKGDKVIMTELEKVSVEVKDTLIQENGSGIPPESMLKDVKIEAVVAAAQVPDWVNSTMETTGAGAVDTKNENKAQAKLMAFRAAELDARRKLGEQINGLKISSKTTVQDFITQSDEIRTSMLTFQQGAHVVEGSQKLLEDGTATAQVSIDLRPLWDMVVYYEKKLSITIK